MERTAAPGQLSRPRVLSAVGSGRARPTATRSSPWRFALANRSDDREVRRLVSEEALDGAIRFSQANEPDSRHAAGILGDRHQRLLARDVRTGRAVAIGSRSVYRGYLNGEVDEIGYLSGLRIEPGSRRSPSLLRDGFGFLRALHEEDGGPEVYLACVMSDNRAALRLLGSGLTGFPHCTPLESIETLLLPTSRASRRRLHDGLRTATANDLDSITALLDREHRGFQFAPAWTSPDLLDEQRTRGLAPEDIVLAEEGGRLLGSIALWDQRAFRQTIVRGYAPALARVRPLWNAIAWLRRAPILPAPGSVLPLGYLALGAVRGGEERTASALVAEALRLAAARGIELVALGLAARHPWLPSLRRAFPHRRLTSELCAFSFDRDGAALTAIDRERIPHLELATL